MKTRILALGAALACIVGVVQAGTATAQPPSRSLTHRPVPPQMAVGQVGTWLQAHQPAQRGRLAYQRQDLSLSDYYDECGDAPSALDLRRTTVAQDSTTDSFIFEAATCKTFGLPAIGDNGFLWFLSGAAGDFGVFIGVTNGSLLVDVVSMPSDDPDTWTVTYEGTAHHDDDVEDAYSVGAAFPESAIGGNPSFDFVAESQDAAGTEDDLPELDADVLAYPNPCTGVILPDSYTVTTDTGAVPAVVGAAHSAGLGTQVVSSRHGIVTVTGASGPAASGLRHVHGVRHVEPTMLLHRTAVTPNDPAFGQQWALTAIGAPAAWSVTTGSGSLIAVVDDGVDGTRPDLRGRVVAGRDEVSGTTIPAGADSDLGGHGTSVAGVAAAAGNNGVGLAGVDWSARIMPLRIYDASGCTDDAQMAAGLMDAADAGARVINVSSGGAGSTSVLQQGVQYAQSKGALVVASAGNDGDAGDEVVYPAAYPGVVAVGASTSTGSVASYSETGSYVSLVAPGGDGSGTPGGDVLVLGEHGSVTPEAGTSFAAPLVSGAAALYWSRHKTAKAAGVAAALTATATDIGPPGRDDASGAGLLNLAALLAPPQARATTNACPPGQVPAAGFTDVPADNVHRANIDCVVWWGVAHGTTATTYSPGDGTPRDQMAAFIARLVTAAGGSLPANPPDAFADDNGDMFESDINALAAAGIVKGSGGRYVPHATVSRGEMAAYLVRAYDYVAATPLTHAIDYFDDDAGSVFEGVIDDAAAAGFTGGFSDGTYRPGQPVLRDQMASFLARVLDLLVVDGTAKPPSAT